MTEDDSWFAAEFRKMDEQLLYDGTEKKTKKGKQVDVVKINYNIQPSIFLNQLVSDCLHQCRHLLYRNRLTATNKSGVVLEYRPQ